MFVFLIARRNFIVINQWRTNLVNIQENFQHFLVANHTSEKFYKSLSYNLSSRIEPSRSHSFHSFSQVELESKFWTHFKRLVPNVTLCNQRNEREYLKKKTENSISQFSKKLLLRLHVCSYLLLYHQSHLFCWT